jgi:hypothetical protein
MVTPRIFLWCRLIILTITKNRLSFLVSAALSNRHEKYHFSCRLLKTANTKNESLFLVAAVLNNRNQSPGAARGQKIETNGHEGEAEKYLSAPVLSLLYPLVGSSLFSLLSFRPLSSLFSLVFARRQSAR